MAMSTHCDWTMCQRADCAACYPVQRPAVGVEDQYYVGAGLTPPAPTLPPGRIQAIRTFETGATRNLDDDRLDFEGFLSPTALTAFAEYMHRKRLQADGTMRSSDNWQKGIPLDSYMKSMFRHFMEVWSIHRGAGGALWTADKGAGGGDLKEALCALLFNVQGYLHETLKLTNSRDEVKE